MELLNTGHFSHLGNEQEDEVLAASPSLSLPLCFLNKSILMRLKIKLFKPFLDIKYDFKSHQIIKMHN